MRTRGADAVQLLLAALLLLGLPLVSTAAMCPVEDTDTLRDCAQYLQWYDGILFQADVTCRDRDCCSVDGPLLTVRGATDKVIDGQGHQLLRLGDLRGCPAFAIEASARVTLQALTVDDHAGEPAITDPDEFYGPTGRIVDSTGVTLAGVQLRHSRKHALLVTNVHGLTFTDGEITGASIFGLYVGNVFLGKPSTNVSIQRSRFAQVGTNAVIFQGVINGHITDNLFVENHRHGAYLVCNGICGGGQVGLFAGADLVIANNVITQGYCDNCVGHFSAGIELSNDGGMALPQTVISGNVISDNYGVGIFWSGSLFDARSIHIENNILLRNAYGGLLVPGSVQVENIVR